MSRQGRDWAATQRTGDFTLKAVLNMLGHLADARGVVYHGQATIAARLECDKRTVRRALQALELLGLIRREERKRKDGSRSTDHIFLEISATESPAEPAAAPGLSAPTRGQDTRRVGTAGPEGGDRQSSLTTFESDSESGIESSSEPDGSAPLGGAGLRDFRKELFGEGLVTVRALTGRPPLGCRRLVAGWLTLVSDDAATVLRAIEEAVASEAVEPVSKIEGILRRAARPKGQSSAPAAQPIAVDAVAARNAAGLERVRRGEWPTGCTHQVLADSPAAAAWEAYFARFGVKARWMQLRDGLGAFLPAPLPPADPVDARPVADEVVR